MKQTFGFIKRVAKGRFATVKDLGSRRIDRWPSSFALTKGYRSKRPLFRSFTVVIRPLTTRLIKAKILN